MFNLWLLKSHYFIFIFNDRKYNTKTIIKEFPINNKIFAYYLIIILCLYFFFIQKYCIDNYLSNYAISDLLIHYNGEFLRRGLIGTFY